MSELTGGTFRAMGTQITTVFPASSPVWIRTAGFDRVAEIFAEEEQRFSRFRGDSELTSVNAASGRWTNVSTGFERLVGFALRQAERLDGLFDPTVLHAIIAAGYDRDFDEVLAGARGALHPPQPCGRWAEIDQRPGGLRLPAGVGLDLGAVAKGWTADLAAEAAVDSGLPWALVSAGGDLRIAGDVAGIDVAIEDPGVATEEVARVRLTSGALASSSTIRRAWGPGLHHVIDPRTGAPSDAVALQATVWAPTCAEAETLATWAILTGPAALDSIPGAIATTDGDLFMNFATAEVAA
ncbi:MAG: FAD:protein FMN transferase [Actinomycetota bacterium]